MLLVLRGDVLEYTVESMDERIYSCVPQFPLVGHGRQEERSTEEEETQEIINGQLIKEKRQDQENIEQGYQTCQ